MLRNKLIGSLLTVLLVATILVLTPPAVDAATITINGTQVNGWSYGGTTATLRFFANQDFLTAEGEFVKQGNSLTGIGFFRSYTCAVSGTTLTIPAITNLPTTTDSPDVPSAKWTARFYDYRGIAHDNWMTNFKFSHASTSPQTWAIIRNYNIQPGPQPPLTYPTGDQVAQMINAVLPVADASDVIKGKAKLTVAPAVSTNPVAVGDNDPRVPTQSENDALIGTSGTPSSSNKYVTNADTGTSGASKVLRLGSDGKLPALDGSKLTNLPVGTGLLNLIIYGADPTGAADSLNAWNAAIADCNSAGAGVLYLPPGRYKHTATPTTITCTGGLIGEGTFDDPAIPATSQINFTSGSTNALNIASRNFLVRGVGLSNTAGTNPTAGYGVNVTGSNLYQKVDFENVSVYRFFHGIHQDGGLWHMNNVTITTSIDYQMLTENSFNDDAGDWVMDSCRFMTVGAFPPIALKIKNGGGHVDNLKINGTVDGIIAVEGANTSNLQIANTSIENFTGNAIFIHGGTPAFSWGNVQLDQVQIYPDPTNTTNIGIAATATQNLQLNNIKCVAGVTPGAACIVAGTTSSNWSVGTIDLNGWPRDIQSGGSYTGAPLPGSAVGTVAVASNRINPQYQLFHLTCGGGANTVKNIFLNGASMSPYDNRNYTIKFVADEPCPWDNTGNIGTAAGTMAVNRLVVAQYIRGDKWYLSQ